MPFVYAANMVDQLTNCKMIIRYGHGYDTVDVDACTEAGIIVTNIAGSTSEEVSNHALALMLACARELKRLDLATTQGRWAEVYSREICSRIFGETVGIVGFGWIGRAFGIRAIGSGLGIRNPASNISALVAPFETGFSHVVRC